MVRQTTTKPPPLSGYQTVFTREECEGEREIFIYGDPAGLRSLARLLEYIADLNQKKEPFPDEHDSYHHHTTIAGKYAGHSQRITVGRADDKKGKNRFDVFPKPKKNG
jgi:hypothetical protein